MCSHEKYTIKTFTANPNITACFLYQASILKLIMQNKHVVKLYVHKTDVTLLQYLKGPVFRNKSKYLTESEERKGYMYTIYR
jgi:hypothetical protein